MKTVGIDGCKAGWITVTFDENPRYRMLYSDDELIEMLQSSGRVFIDMPIGLEDEMPTRKCDELLRQKLSDTYSSTVFSPPIRPALNAPSYVEANMQSFEYTGKKLALQSWNMTPKIKVLDRFLNQHKELRETVLESHPELLFMNLNRGIIYQKKNTKKGLRHRLDLIKQYEPIAADFFREIKEEYRRNEVGEDDIVDALVLALAAKQSAGKTIKTLPEIPPIDSTGLKMAMHYI